MGLKERNNIVSFSMKTGDQEPTCKIFCYNRLPPTVNLLFLGWVNYWRDFSIKTNALLTKRAWVLTVRVCQNDWLIVDFIFLSNCSISMVTHQHLKKNLIYRVSQKYSFLKMSEITNKMEDFITFGFLIVRLFRIRTFICRWIQKYRKYHLISLGEI